MTLFEEHLSEVINEIVPSNLSIHLCSTELFPHLPLLLLLNHIHVGKIVRF